MCPNRHDHPMDLLKTLQGDQKPYRPQTQSRSAKPEEGLSQSKVREMNFASNLSTDFNLSGYFSYNIQNDSLPEARNSKWDKKPL